MAQNGPLVKSTPADGVIELLKHVLVRKHRHGWGRCQAWTWLISMISAAVLHGRAFIQFTAVQAGSINAVKDFNKGAFWAGRRRMFIVILKLVGFSAAQNFAAEKFKNIWRRVSTEALLSTYLGDGNIYYRAKLTGTLSNPDHRLTSDVQSIVDDVTDISKMLPEHVTNVVGLTGVMWKTSPFACTILWSYVLIITVTSRTYFEQQTSRLELAVQAAAAHCRYALQRIHECAEGIAFYGAAGAEQQRLVGMVNQLAAEESRLLKMAGIFGSVERLFSWIASILPSMIMAPRFWSGLNKFADYSQMVNGFRKVKDALFFLADNYDRLASITARVERIEELRCYSKSDRFAGKIALPGPPRDALVEVKGVRVAVPSSNWGPAKWLGSSEGICFTLQQGGTLLIQGESGVGKSSLLRSIAGIWDDGHGTICRADNIYFLPQTPYLPAGHVSVATTLRAQLAYPTAAGGAGGAEDALLHNALGEVKLGHLSDRIDAATDWNTMLSGGEKQRLVFARLLVRLRVQVVEAPVVLLDEATSACSEQTEEHLYHALLECIQPRKGAVITVGHRSSLRKFHQQLLTLE